MARRKRYVTVQTASGPFQAYCESRRKGEDCIISSDGVECDGYLCSEAREIVIDGGAHPARMKQKLFHESCHLLFEDLTGDMFERIFGGASRARRAQIEELIVSFLDMRLYDLLVRNGWLTMPEPPQ